MRHAASPLVLVILLSACTVGDAEHSANGPDPASLVGPTRKATGQLAGAWKGLVFEDGMVRPAGMTPATPDPEAVTRFATLGQQELSAGRPVAAIAAFTLAILAGPDEAPEIFVGLGQALLRVRERDRAEAAFRTALALDPTHPEAHDRLAQLLYQLGRRDEAVAHWQRAVAGDPGLASAHLRLASAYFYRGATRSASTHLESAQSLGTRVPFALSEMLAGRQPPRASVRTSTAGSSAGTRIRIDPGGGTAMAAETAIAANLASPGELVAAWNDLRESPTDGFWRLGVGTSIDGGQTWSDFVVRPPVDAQTLHEGDPMTAFDPRTGDLWIGGTAFFESIFVARKIPGATSFEPSVVAHQGPFVDKGWLAAGPPPGEPMSTHLYLAHNEGFQVSDDLGATWSQPISLGDIISPVPRVTPDGEVYISSWEAFGDEIWLHRSFDGGDSLDGPRPVAIRMDVWGTQTQDHTPGQYRLPPLPISAVDPNDGTLYCIYPDTTGVNVTEYNVDLYFTRSDNQGLDWSTPTIINGDSDPPADQFFPWLEVDADGGLHLVFFDTRRIQQSDTAPNGLIDVYHSFSSDGGSTWTERRLTPTPFDTSHAEWPSMGQFLGDFIGLSIADEKIYVIYPSTENGDLDIFVQTIPPDLIFADGFESGDTSAWSSTT